MTDTQFADVSEFQVDVNDQYPYQFISFRSNDGTYRDHHFAYNLAWAKHATDIGKLGGFMVYFVWEPNWQQTVETFKSMVGTPHPKMAVMIDVEAWGRLSGNQSAGINAARENIIAWLGGNRKKVIGYANAGDFNSLWPSRGDTKVILANYSGNPSFPGKIAHQYSSTFNVPPFGKCDINSADGLNLAQFLAVLGIGGSAPKPPVKPPVKPPAPKPSTGDYIVKSGDTLSGIANQMGVTLSALIHANPQITNPNNIQVGQAVHRPGAAPTPKPTPKPVPKPAPKPSGDYTVVSGDTMGGIASRLGVSLATLEKANPQIVNPNNIYPGQKIHRPGGAAPAPAPAPKRRTYTVKNGDTMSGIASAYHVTLAALEHANPSITNPNNIYPGQVLTLP
jgi:LysM repeat protein